MCFGIVLSAVLMCFGMCCMLDNWKNRFSFLCSAGKERALVISNHRSDIDWLVGWIIAQRLGCLGGTRAVMKKSTKFLPVIGWSMWFSEYVFLSRNWTKDEKVLKNGYSSLKGFPRTL